jgi:NAD(P)-dependent dehydrogenase (short-subunit alcohol dehydrogenase family)
MDDKIILVTGAKGGLGSFVTQNLLVGGATVVGSSRSIQASDFPHPNFVAIPADFANRAVVRALADQVVTKFGKIDALVHVMGGFAGGSSIAETSDDTWDRMRDLNLTAAFYATRAVLPHMRKAKRGRIVAVGSLAATEPRAGLGAYVVFKSALVTLVQTIALENSDSNITANVVLPGTMDTPANRASMPTADFSKWVSPEDVAKLIVWLAADQSVYVNGAVIPIQSRNA